MNKLIFPLLVCLLPGVIPHACADDAIPTVTVSSVKNPELRSYRTLMAGLDAFEKNHELAPAAAELRFRLIPKSKRARAGMNSLSLKIEAPELNIPVALAPDGSFTLPRDQAALDADAKLILNRSNGQFEGLPLVRTPGLPANVMRLGDLRLECKVLIAAVKHELGIVARATITTLLGGSDWCEAKSGDFWHASPGTLDGAMIVSGSRRAALPVKDESFLPPLADKSWPDDALIQFDIDAEAPPG